MHFEAQRALQEVYHWTVQEFNSNCFDSCPIRLWVLNMKTSHGNFNTNTKITEDWPWAEQVLLQMADYELDLKHWKLLEATRAAMEHP